MPATQELLTEPDFYAGYRKRLETKLEQKFTQIARAKSLRDSLSEEEKPAFMASLQRAISERDEIQLLLDQIDKSINRKPGAK